MKISVKATIHEGINKNLFDLPDRRVEIKKMHLSLPLVRHWDELLLRQENFWLSSKLKMHCSYFYFILKVSFL